MFSLILLSNGFLCAGSIARSRGMFAHLLGKALPSERKGYDSIFLTSTGRLTSYSPTGQPNWQVGYRIICNSQ